FSYTPMSGDPLGIGELTNLDSADAHAACAASDYPDGLVQVALLAGSSRAGDIILSATRDWDFRGKWEPIPHVSAHGALHREHMMVPLLVNRPVVSAPRRTVDIFATAAKALGLTPVPGAEGSSWL